MASTQQQCCSACLRLPLPQQPPLQGAGHGGTLPRCHPHSLAQQPLACRVPQRMEEPPRIMGARACQRQTTAAQLQSPWCRRQSQRQSLWSPLRALLLADLRLLRQHRHLPPLQRRQRGRALARSWAHLPRVSASLWHAGRAGREGPGACRSGRSKLADPGITDSESLLPAGVANGTAEAGKSIAQGAVAVAGTAGSAGDATRDQAGGGTSHCRACMLCMCLQMF